MAREHEVDFLLEQQPEDGWPLYGSPGTFEQSYATYGPARSDNNIQITVGHKELLPTGNISLTVRIRLVSRDWFGPAKGLTIYGEVLWGSGDPTKTGKWVCITPGGNGTARVTVQDHAPKVEF